MHRRIRSTFNILIQKITIILCHVWTDLSSWALVITNIVTITAAYLQHWPFSTIIWVYWCQTLIIGVFAFLRAISLTDLSPTRVDRLRLRFSHAGKLRAGAFFLAHFTVAQACLTFILWMLIGPVTNVNAMVLLFSATLFFCNHCFSYVYNKKRERIVTKNIGLALLRPYLRLLPLLASLLFAGMILAAFYLIRDQQLVPIAYLVLFVLKTGADVAAHMLEHGALPIRRRQRQYND